MRLFLKNNKYKFFFQFAAFRGKLDFNKLNTFVKIATSNNSTKKDFSNNFSYVLLILLSKAIS